MKLFDYHTQALSHEENAVIKIEETIESAIEKRLDAICLTDHFPLPIDFDDPTKDVRIDYPLYVKKVLAAKETYKEKIEVLLGAEFDWLPNHQNYIKEQVTKYPFDYVLGSVHYVLDAKEKRKAYAIDFKEEDFFEGVTAYGSIEAFVKQYYLDVCDLIQSELFDGLGHLDRIKVFNTGDIFSEESPWYRKIVLETLDILGKSSMVMEVNTSGFYKKNNSLYPSPWILEESNKKNIPIILGSDAHFPEHVGRDLEKTIRIIKEAGYSSFVRFKKRDRIIVNI